MTVAVDEKNPPTFELSGSGNLNQFHVMEVPASNQEQTTQRSSDVNILLWEVRPTGEDKIRRLPKITYGQVPAGFNQVFPAAGISPPALAEGKVYEVEGTAYNANGGLIWIVVRGGKIVEIPVPGSQG